MRCSKAGYWMTDSAGYATTTETCVLGDVRGRCPSAGWALLRRVDALYGRAPPKKFLAVTSEGARVVLKARLRRDGGLKARLRRDGGRTGTARRAMRLIPGEKGNGLPWHNHIQFRLGGEVKGTSSQARGGAHGMEVARDPA